MTDPYKDTKWIGLSPCETGHNRNSGFVTGKQPAKTLSDCFSKKIATVHRL